MTGYLIMYHDTEMLYITENLTFYSILWYGTLKHVEERIGTVALYFIVLVSQ